MDHRILNADVPSAEGFSSQTGTQFNSTEQRKITPNPVRRTGWRWPGYQRLRHCSVMLLQGGRHTVADEKDVCYLYESWNPRPGNLCFTEETHVLSRVQLLNAKGHRNCGTRQSKRVTWLWLISQPSFLYPPILCGNVVPGEKRTLRHL